MFEWIKQKFSRPSNIPKPGAEQTETSILNRMLPRRYRTYNLKTNKQKQLRNLSRNGIVRRGIEVIKRGVLSLDYEIKPLGKVNKAKLEHQSKIINTILQNPNIIHDYESFWNQVLEDLIVLDAGVFNKVKGGNPMRPLFLYPIDGITIDILQPYEYTNPDAAMYVQKINLLQEVFFSPKEMSYLKINHFTDTPYGLSPVEAIWRYLNYFMDALDNSSDIASVDTAKFMVGLEGASADELKQFREYMQDQIEGTGHIPAINRKATSAQIGAINSDSLFIDFQKYLLTLCAKCFHLPESFFITADVNDRNNLSEVQSLALRQCIKPYAKVIQKAINEFLKELGIFDVEVKFIFEETLEEKKTKTEIVAKQVAFDIITLNDASIELRNKPLDSEYAKYTISEVKARINEKHSTNLGKDQYANNPQTKVSDKGGK